MIDGVKKNSGLRKNEAQLFKGMGTTNSNGAATATSNVAVRSSTAEDKSPFTGTAKSGLNYTSNFSQHAASAASKTLYGNLNNGNHPHTSTNSIKRVKSRRELSDPPLVKPSTSCKQNYSSARRVSSKNGMNKPVCSPARADPHVAPALKHLAT